MHIKSYIRDSADFLNKYLRQLDPNREKVTLDVISLYTSIPHELGPKALSTYLSKIDNGIS